ncbi:unnamed protein product [Pleuronectes platessa]|uniref:Uncharacterized protein n=1 Tax=Pleuronectes platessa TaxID=8262 RepID=A0A9N7Z371_PLEPL|nr:unnamed protein product [Pleuronectes platessa]
MKLTQPLQNETRTEEDGLQRRHAGPAAALMLLICSCVSHSFPEVVQASVKRLRGECQGRSPDEVRGPGAHIRPRCFYQLLNATPEPDDLMNTGADALLTVPLCVSASSRGQTQRDISLKLTRPQMTSEEEEETCGGTDVRKVSPISS